MTKKSMETPARDGGEATKAGKGQLRRRMIEGMTVRGFAPSTQRGYLAAAARRPTNAHAGFTKN